MTSGGAEAGPELYIQRSDWKGEAVKGYHGLTPGGSVGLVGTNLILHCESVESDAGSETPARLMCSVSERKGAPRTKGNIQWVAKQVPASCRLFCVSDEGMDGFEGCEERGCRGRLRHADLDPSWQ